MKRHEDVTPAIARQARTRVERDNDQARVPADGPAVSDDVSRQSPKVPPWVTDLAKWGSLSRAERRKMERYHRRLNGQ
jgi:Trm5-related predicted tRNA methylase